MPRCERAHRGPCPLVVQRSVSPCRGTACVSHREPRGGTSFAAYGGGATPPCLSRSTPPARLGSPGTPPLPLGCIAASRKGVGSATLTVQEAGAAAAGAAVSPAPAYVAAAAPVPAGPTAAISGSTRSPSLCSSCCRCPCFSDMARWAGFGLWVSKGLAASPWTGPSSSQAAKTGARRCQNPHPLHCTAQRWLVSGPQPFNYSVQKSVTCSSIHRARIKNMTSRHRLPRKLHVPAAPSENGWMVGRGRAKQICDEN